MLQSPPPGSSLSSTIFPYLSLFSSFIITFIIFTLFISIFIHVMTVPKSFTFLPSPSSSSLLSPGSSVSSSSFFRHSHQHTPPDLKHPLHLSHQIIILIIFTILFTKIIILIIIFIVIIVIGIIAALSSIFITIFRLIPILICFIVFSLIFLIIILIVLSTITPFIFITSLSLIMMSNIF